MIKHTGELFRSAYVVALIAAAGCVARDMGGGQGTGGDLEGGLPGSATSPRKPAAASPSAPAETLALDLVGNKIVAVPDTIRLPAGARSVRVQATRGGWMLDRCQLPDVVLICSRKERNNPDFEGFFFQLGENIDSVECASIGSQASASFDIEYMAGWNRRSGIRKTVFVVRNGSPEPEPSVAASPGSEPPRVTPLPEETPMPIIRDNQTIFLDVYRGPGGKRVGLARPGGFAVPRPDQVLRFKALRGTWGVEDTVLNPGKLEYLGAGGTRHPATREPLRDEMWFSREKELASPSIGAGGYIFNVSVYEGTTSLLEEPLPIKIQYLP